MEDFKLLSIELDALGGASISYTHEGLDGPEEFKTKQTRTIHPDLRDLFLQGLRKRVTWLLGFPEDCEESVTPIGLSVSGKDTLIYHARVGGPAGVYKVKTPKIFSNEEDDKFFSEIEKEAKAYIYDGKGAQLSIFGDE